MNSFTHTHTHTHKQNTPAHTHRQEVLYLSECSCRLMSYDLLPGRIHNNIQRRRVAVSLFYESSQNRKAVVMSGARKTKAINSDYIWNTIRHNYGKEALSSEWQQTLRGHPVCWKCSDVICTPSGRRAPRYVLNVNKPWLSSNNASTRALWKKTTKHIYSERRRNSGLLSTSTTRQDVASRL